MKTALRTFLILAAVTCAAAASAADLEYNTDRPGMDYRSIVMDKPDPDICREACLADPKCRAFTYVHPGVQGPKARCWLKDDVPPAQPGDCCISGVKTGVKEAMPLEYNIDRPGRDYRDFDMTKADPNRCRRACIEDPRCAAFTYVKPGIQGPQARCWLKDSAPPPSENDCCISGRK